MMIDRQDIAEAKREYDLAWEEWWRAWNAYQAAIKRRSEAKRHLSEVEHATAIDKPDKEEADDHFELDLALMERNREQRRDSMTIAAASPKPEPLQALQEEIHRNSVMREETAAQERWQELKALPQGEEKWLRMLLFIRDWPFPQDFYGEEAWEHMQELLADVL
mgnify:CR=1 FL=1